MDGDQGLTARAFWRAPELGTQHEVRLPQGTLRYHARGAGRPIVFAHGWLANANLWRKVVDALADRFLCLTPDLPFGSHVLPLDGGADLTPAGCGRLICDFIAALDLEDVTLVGNDSGGAYSQIATATDSSRIARLVLNACETPYDSFPPVGFQPLKLTARAGAEALAALLAPLSDPEVRASPAAYGMLAKYGIAREASDTYVLPVQASEGVRRDAAKVMGSADEVALRAAGRTLCAGFDKPVLFAWAAEDKFFPLESVRRYAGELADARVEMIADAYSFTPEDQPGRLAELIAAFAS